MSLINREDLIAEYDRVHVGEPGGARKLMEDAPTIEEHKWIPVTERLPELDADGYSDKVLVCFSNFTGCEICEYRECDDCHGWYVGDSDENPEDIGVHVIAWMSLPEPYREDPCYGCDYLGESCVGEGCGRITE